MTAEILEPQVEVVKEELSIELRVSNAFSSELGKLGISEDELRADAEKAMTIVIKDLNDKEGWKQADEARKNLKVKRVTIQKTGKYIRDEANAYAKRVITRQDELVGLIDEAETYLDNRQKEIQAEKDRIKQIEEDKKTERFTTRTVELTQLGASFNGSSFILGEMVVAASDIKNSSQELYQQNVLIPFEQIYEKLRVEKIAEEERLAEERRVAEEERATAERLRMEAEQKLAEERAEMLRQQAEFRKQQEEFEAKKRETERIEEEMARKAEWEKQKAIEIAEKERIAAENAIIRERERLEAEQRATELKKQQEEAEKAEKLAAASDKEKWNAFVIALGAVRVPEMRSGQYRKKSAVARGKQEEILSL